MRRGVVAVLAVVALPVVSCSGGDADADRYLLTLDGEAELESGARLRSGEHRLEVADVVRITDGTAILGLPGRRTLELRAGAEPADDSRVEVAEVPTLVDGHGLLLAGEDETARLRTGATTIAVREGAARVRRSTGVHVAVYEGRAEVGALGRSRPVGVYRQMAVPDTGTLPRGAEPLAYDRHDLDPWDRRFLGAAVDLGAQLERASLALNRRLASPPAADPNYFRQLVPGLRSQTAFGVDLLDDRRSAGETVVGAAIVLGGPGAFAERWDLAFEFRADGADWGLVALDQQAQRGAVVGVLAGILDAVAATTPGSTVSSVNGGGVGGAEEPGAVPSDPGSASPSLPLPGRPTAPTLPGPSPELPLVPEDPDDDDPTPDPPTDPEPVGSLLEPVTDTLDGVVDTVEGLLGGSSGPLLG